MAINDFGEKIGGARKDLWKERNMILSDLHEMNAAEKLKYIKKDNVWKKPDYEALRNEGFPIKVVYFIKKVRDSIGTKPELTYFDDTPEAKLAKQEKYIDFVGCIRDAVMACKTEKDVLALGTKRFLYENEFIESESSYYVRPTDKAGGMITNKFLNSFVVNDYSLRRYDNEIKKKQFLYSDEDKILANYNFLKYENVVWEEDYRDRVSMKVNNSRGYYYFYPTGEFADASSWVEGTYFAVNDKTGKIVARNIESIEEAKKYVVANDLASVNSAPKKKGKTRFVPAQLANIKRDGKDVRFGKAAQGQDYLDRFGFKGGEFGNWMSEKDRQFSLDYGYDALFDLAQALKIDPKDVSLGNELSIAFGARGVGSALAHYEPAREVINLTKMKGAGSLAHEWGHALDDILGKKLGLSGFMTENLYNKKVPESLKTLVDVMKYKKVADKDVASQRIKDAEDYASRLRRSVDSYFPRSCMTDEQIGHKNELIDAFINSAKTLGSECFSYAYTGVGIATLDALSDFKKEITGKVIPKDVRIGFANHLNSLRYRLENVDKPQRVNTAFYDNSLMFDKQHSKTDHGYWASTVEMFARAFACYVKDKVEGQSDYLCGHADAAIGAFVEPKTGQTSVLKAYPEGEERLLINKCFDEFIQELKEMGLLHHKEDFTVDFHNGRSVLDVEREWGRMPQTEEEAYPLSLFDILTDAEERSSNVINENKDDLEYY